MSPDLAVSTGLGGEKAFYERDWQRRIEAAITCAVTAIPRAEAMLSLLRGGERLLDLGCGDGSFAALAKRLYQEVFGIDISSSALKVARERGATVCQLNLNEDELRFPAEYFDAIVCFHVIEHIFDPVDILRKVFRVLKPEGQFLLTCPNILQWRKLITLVFSQSFPRTSGDPMGYDGGHLHYFTLRDMEGLLRAAGFREIRAHALFAGGRPWAVFIKQSLPRGVLSWNSCRLPSPLLIPKVAQGTSRS